MIALYLATGIIAHPVVVPVGSVNTPGGYDFLGRSGKRKRKIEDDDYSEPIPLEIKKTVKAPHEINAEPLISKHKAAIAATDLRDKLATDKAKQKHRAKLLAEDEWFILN